MPNAAILARIIHSKVTRIAVAEKMTEGSEIERKPESERSDEIGLVGHQVQATAAGTKVIGTKLTGKKAKGIR